MPDSGDPGLLQLGVKVLTLQKYELEQLGVYLYYKNNTKNLRSMIASRRWEASTRDADLASLARGEHVGGGLSGELTFGSWQ